MKKIIQYSLLGALIGLSTTYIIITVVLLINPTRVIDGKELLLQCILAVSLGVGCGLITLIFYLDRLQTVVKLAVHYIFILILVLICGAIGDWYESPAEQPVSFVMFIVIQLFIYIIILAAVYWIDLQSIKKINEKLKRK
ncbi:DUF3021 domain-containing protein [Heyndrickxia sp. NPDC080065]|uniref:DUF3021 domain-containing protein n=1 Tax=Heyndrickxia sp. NPDC080065 TaxID=3390568 RepID=UPI003D01E05F